MFQIVNFQFLSACCRFIMIVPTGTWFFLWRFDPGRLYALKAEAAHDSSHATNRASSTKWFVLCFLEHERVFVRIAALCLWSHRILIMSGCYKILSLLENLPFRVNLFSNFESFSIISLFGEIIELSLFNVLNTLL